MITLAQHLKNLNAEKQAWMDAGPDRWTGFYVEELEFWAEYGVTTVAEFKRHENETLFWEMYMDVTGCRPRHINLKDMSDEVLEKEIDLLGRMMEDEIKRDEEWEAEMIAYAQEDAEIENVQRDEAPLAIDYVAHNYQEGWL
jgi:translation elongation factor EF-Ts